MEILFIKCKEDGQISPDEFKLFQQLLNELLNKCLKDKGLKINEGKTKVMCESFGTGTTQVVGNVKHPCSVCLKGVGVNSIRCT